MGCSGLSGRRLRSALFILAVVLCSLLYTSPLPSPAPHLAQPATSCGGGLPPHSHDRVLVLLLCKSATARTLERLRTLAAAGLDAHAVPDEEPLPAALQAGRVHWAPTAAVQAAGMLLLNPKMDANVSTWDRALLYASTANQGRHVWLVEDDVWFPSAGALARVVDAYASRAEDLVASELLSRGPGVDEEPWYWFQDGHVLQVRGLGGAVMLPRYPGAPTMGTLNVLCRLSPRLVAEVAAMGRAHGRLILHEALFPSIVAAKWEAGWSLTWLAHPWAVIRWRPLVLLEEARAGARSHGWLVVHPVKLNASLAFEQDAVLEGEDAA